MYSYTFEIVKESADYILERTSHRPKIGIICGSGLGGLGDLLQNRNEFPYEEIPHFPVSTGLFDASGFLQLNVIYLLISYLCK